MRMFKYYLLERELTVRIDHSAPTFDDQDGFDEVSPMSGQVINMGDKSEIEIGGQDAAYTMEQNAWEEYFANVWMNR